MRQTAMAFLDSQDCLIIQVYQEYPDKLVSPPELLFTHPPELLFTQWGNLQKILLSLWFKPISWKQQQLVLQSSWFSHTPYSSFERQNYNLNFNEIYSLIETVARLITPHPTLQSAKTYQRQSAESRKLTIIYLVLTRPLSETVPWHHRKWIWLFRC